MLSEVIDRYAPFHWLSSAGIRRPLRCVRGYALFPRYCQYGQDKQGRIGQIR